MDVRLTYEQRALQESAAQLAGRLGPRSVTDLADGERQAKLDAAVAAAGWRELREVGDDGAPLASVVEVAIVAEELSRRLADTAYLGPMLAAELRRVAGLPASSTPESVVLGSDLGSIAETGVAVDSAGCSHGLGILGSGLIGRAELGEIAAEPVDLTRSVTIVDGPLTAVTDAAPEPDSLTRWTAFGLALTCADLVGVMRGAIELSCGYAETRRQYGAAIGSFQAVQHLLADAKVAMEGSRSVALHAAWAADSLDAAAALTAASVAKAYCARAARAVCEIGIQVHGGIGNTWECLAHVYLRRALTSADVLGGVGPSLLRVRNSHQIGGPRGLQ